MIRSIVFTLFLSSFAFVKCSIVLNKVQPPSFEIEDFYLNELIRNSTRVNLSYTFGERVEGDFLVYTANDCKEYEAPEEGATICLDFDGHYIITYAELSVDQDNEEGNAYIRSGEIGDEQVEFCISAVETQNLCYDAKIYGYIRDELTQNN